MSGGSRRISIGFKGGQVLAARVTEEQFKALQDALGGSAWHELEAEDGTLRLDLSAVVYVSAESDEARVGFG